jgi:RimJ/RimL family protein N-acetyltransferase
MRSISIREPTQEDSRQLASLLCEDRILRRNLGMARENRPTGEEFDQGIRDWCRSRNASTYAIVFDDGTVVGTISLSHINHESHSARIGIGLAAVIGAKDTVQRRLKGLWRKHYPGALKECALLSNKRIFPPDGSGKRTVDTRCAVRMRK